MQQVLSRAVLQVIIVNAIIAIVIMMSYVNQENGFSDILVGISPDVPESPEMLEQLKQVLTKASASLYRATR